MRDSTRLAGAGSFAMCLLLASCRGDVPPPGAGAPADARSPAADAVAGAAWQRCTNTAGGFSAEFPADWQTNDGSVMPPCTLFDPQEILIPEASELPADIAVGIHVQDVAFDRVAESTFGIRLLSSEARTVAGRPGMRRLTEQTGDGLLDAGVRSWEYVVDWGDGRTLLAVSRDVGVPDFELKRRVLDEMMHRLQRH
jgi:hypothetical protein